MTLISNEDFTNSITLSPGGSSITPCEAVCNRNSPIKVDNTPLRSTPKNENGVASRSSWTTPGTHLHRARPTSSRNVSKVTGSP
jgi:hypothetical protein